MQKVTLVLLGGWNRTYPLRLSPISPERNAKSTKPARQLGTRICTGNPRMRRRVGRSESFLLTGQGEIVGLISCGEYVAFIRLSNWSPGYGEQARRTPLYFWQPRLDGMGIPPTMCPQVSPNI